MIKKGQQQKKVVSKVVIPMTLKLSQKYLSLKIKNSNVLETIKSLGSLHSPSDHEKSSSRLELKFCQKLSQEHLLLGNEYQLNLIDFTKATKEHNQISYLWSIQHKDKITDLFVFPKIHKIFVIHHSYLRCYGYKDELIETAPLFQGQLKFKEKLDALYCPKRSTLLVFSGTELTAFEMYAQDDTFKFNKLLSKTYRYQRKDLSFLALPQNQSQNLIIFFENKKAGQKESGKESQKIRKETIYWLQIPITSLKDIVLKEIRQYCEITTQSSSQNRRITILYYKENIFYLLKGCELFALRNCFIIDKIKLSYKKFDSYVFFGSKELIYRYENGLLDAYLLSLNQTSKPQRFEIKSIDTNQFMKPDDSSFFKILLMKKRVVIIYQQPITVNSYQFTFWFAIAHHSDKKEKIQEIFGRKGDYNFEDGSLIQNQLQLAQKIGLQQNQAFYQIWNRCSKATKKDYEWLIATEDYNMIQQQIQNKIKKKSLDFFQITFVLKSALEMLKRKVRNNCSAQVVRQLCVCHFQLCKIYMFEKEKRENLEEGQEININIQDYHYLLNIQLEKQLLDLLGELCIQKKAVIIKIRALLTQFSLIYQMIYHEILPKIVRSLKHNFFLLLDLIPQILPIRYQHQSQQVSLESGLWKKVNLQTTKDYMLLCHYVSFQTQSFFKQFLSSKFYKIYQWHSHGAIPYSLEEIENVVKSNDSNRIFTLLFQVLYEQKQKIGESNLKSIIQKIEQYEELPKRLQRKFYFYSKLYENFKDYFLSEKRSFHSLFEFLSLSEDELFLLYFKKQRAKKGIFILKEIKPIYEDFAVKGGELFIQNMFKFFKSEDSSWSDLKIILNKINNEKKDFHQKNYNILDIIVKGLMEKIKIGTDSETQIGLEEVLPYLEKIPFPSTQGELIENLFSITQIYEEQPLLKSLKINMNLKQILNKGEEVIFKMVENSIQKNQLLQIESEDQMLMMTYKILAEVGEKQGKIYGDKYLNFVFKSFLIIVMQEQRLLSMCQILIKDPFIVRSFNVDKKIIENVIIFLYRKRLYQNPIYLQSKEFINKLIEFIEPNSSKARFMVLSIAFANIFTFQRFRIKYPFFKGYYPTIAEIERLINSLNSEEIQVIEQKNLFEVTFMLKILGEEYQNILETQRSVLTKAEGIQRKSRLQHEIYTLVFLKFIREGLLKKGIQITKNILKIKTSNRVFNIIYPIFLIELLWKELLIRAHQPILRLISHYFYNHTELLQIVVSLTSGFRFSNEEIDAFVDQKQKEKAKILIFDPKNVVLSSSFKRFLKRIQLNDQIEEVNTMFETLWKQISSQREEFKINKIYNIIFRILLQDPFVLAQYIYRKQIGINVKSLRALFTLLGFEPLFNMKELFKVCKVIFEALMTKLKSSMLLSDVLENYQEGQTFKEQMIYTQEYLDSQVNLTSHDLLGSSIMIMVEKIESLQRNPGIQKDQEKKYTQIQELRYRPQFYMKRKEKESKLILQKLNKNKKSQVGILKKGDYNEYPFNDKDNTYTEAKYDLNLSTGTYVNKASQFDEVRQRSEESENFVYDEKKIVKKQKVKIQTLQFDELYHQKFEKLRKKTPTNQQQKIDEFSSVIEDDLLMQECFQNKCIQGGFFCFQKLKKERTSFEQQIEKKVKVVEENQLIMRKDTPEDFEIENSSAFKNEVNNFLFKRTYFNLEVIPRMKQEQKKMILETMIEQIYRTKQFCYSQRIELIYEIKSSLTGTSRQQQAGYALGKKIGIYPQIIKIINETENLQIEDLLPECIFIENLDEKTMIQIIKEQAAEYVKKEQNYIKVAELIGKIFNSKEVIEDMKLMFLIKLCRKYQKSSWKAKKNVKDEIQYLANRIDKKKIQECIEIQRGNKNKDLLEISHLLETIVNLCSFGENRKQ